MNLISVHQSYGDNPPKRIIKTLLVCRLIPLRFINLKRAHTRHGVPLREPNNHAGCGVLPTFFQPFAPDGLKPSIHACLRVLQQKISRRDE